MLVLVLAGTVVAVGAVVQGTVGFGLNLFAAPILALIDPALVPVPILLLSSAQSVMTVLREHGHTDWRGVGWAMVGRLPGTALGVLAVVALPARWFGVFVGASVLACVVLSLISWRPEPTPRALVIAGLASGATATSATIGGPPIALLYQHRAGAQVRATLGAYFLLGSVLSVGGLGLAGQLGTDDLAAAAALVPFLVAGFLVSRIAARWLDARWLRPAVLGVSTIGACLLIARSF